MDSDSFPEENGLSKELMILRSQDDMAEKLLLEEAERDSQEKESSFNLTNLSYASSHPH